MKYVVDYNGIIYGPFLTPQSASRWIQRREAVGAIVRPLCKA